MQNNPNEPREAGAPADISLQEQPESAAGKKLISSAPCPTCGLLVADTLYAGCLP
jgi:hypothetical protein